MSPEKAEGIFLDGDGSSQMNADEAVLTGDSRPVVQMIAVAGENRPFSGLNMKAGSVSGIGLSLLF